MSYTIDDIIKLTNAGFTAEQITALSGINSTVNTIEKKEIIQENTQLEALTNSINTLIEKLSPKELDQESKEEAPKQSSAIEESLAKLNDAIVKMQNTNIVHTEQPEKESTDDILAQIINPPRK